MIEILFARKTDVDVITAGALRFDVAQALTSPQLAQVRANLVPNALTEVNDTNVTLTLGGTPASALLAATSITVGWTGTLAAGRLNANVVQSITNDTNVTGTISAQALTLGWSGTLSGTRGGTGVNNGASTITIGGNVTHAGAFGTTITVTATTNSTLPAGTHTLAGLDVVQTWTAAQAFGVVTATSYNGLTITTSTGTITVPNGTTQTFPGTSGTVVTSVTSAGGSLTGTYPSPTIAANAVTNAMHATMAAWTFKVNNTSGVATPTDVTIDGLTNKTTPVGADEIAIWDSATSGMKKATITAALGAGASGVSSIDTLTGAFTTSNGIASTSNVLQLTAARRTLPTIQIFTSSSGTYTTPANVLWLEILIVGGGGGGGGGGTGGGNGSNGGNTTFSTLTAGGGPGGIGGSAPGAGGTASGGNVSNTPGSYGGVGGLYAATLSFGGFGGPSVLAGLGGGGLNSSVAGTAGATNSGSGGGGGGGAIAGVGSPGGSSGGAVRHIINTPSATYSYAVGGGGAAGSTGTSGGAAGAGAAGIIIVIEHYGS